MGRNFKQTFSKFWRKGILENFEKILKTVEKNAGKPSWILKK